MPTRGLTPDTLLRIELSATMSKNRYTDDPAPVIDQLLALAGSRDDILAAEVGLWIGFYEDDYTRTLTTALRALPLDLAPGIALGQDRRHLPTHTTTGFNGPHGTGLA
ncbi:hypothetical protein [Streptomyces sp. AC495_CC817]|uniref:hypothetical protein n=1 Tax=Streptomyces sp. AC495_CC817 TaxID=2823900 RepID=UPI001C25C85A|nr:hypothetical protein [Streptomyces sp. AC495_CC817]